MADKKYYWLKLKRDFFKRHDIQIIEDMPNGKDYVLFYLKLLVESVDHDGALRFSDTIPYNEQMLSTITKTNIDIVRAAMKIFTELKMVDVLDDMTIYMNEINGFLGSETYWAEKKRRQRIGQCPQNVPRMSNLSKEEKETDKEIELDKDTKKRKRFSPPSLDEVSDYCKDRKNKVDAQTFVDFYTSKGWKVGNSTMKDWKACVRTWEKRDNFNRGKGTQSAKPHHNPFMDDLQGEA